MTLKLLTEIKLLQLIFIRQYKNVDLFQLLFKHLKKKTMKN